MNQRILERGWCAWDFIRKPSLKVIVDLVLNSRPWVSLDGVSMLSCAGGIETQRRNRSLTWEDAHLILTSEILWNTVFHRLRIVDLVPHHLHWKHVRKEIFYWPEHKNCFAVHVFRRTWRIMSLSFKPRTELWSSRERPKRPHSQGRKLSSAPDLYCLSVPFPIIPYSLKLTNKFRRLIKLLYWNAIKWSGSDVAQDLGGLFFLFGLLWNPASSHSLFVCLFLFYYYY